MLRQKGGFVYIMTNKNNSVLYIGVTSNLKLRILQHKEKTFPNSFTAKYNCHKLVWFEFHETIEVAIAREKQLKAGKRSKKIDLIMQINPLWNDLWDEIQEY